MSYAIMVTPQTSPTWNGAKVSTGDIAGAADDRSKPEEVDLSKAREVHPIQMEKDFRPNGASVFDADFRPKPEGDEAPKASGAQGSATTSSFVTGLEDVSEEDLATPVTPNATKGMKSITDNGSQTSSPETSNGKSEPTVVEK